MKFSFRMIWRIKKLYSPPNFFFSFFFKLQEFICIKMFVLPNPLFGVAPQVACGIPFLFQVHRGITHYRHRQFNFRVPQHKVISERGTRLEIYQYQNFNRYWYLKLDVNQYRYRYLKFDVNRYWYRYLKF